MPARSEYSKLVFDRFETGAGSTAQAGGRAPERVEARRGRRQLSAVAAVVPPDLESVLVAGVSLPGVRDGELHGELL